MSVDSVDSIRGLISPKAYLGKGIAWPPREDPLTGDFLKAEAEASVSDCIKNLIWTSIGELTVLTRMGTRIDEILFSRAEASLLDAVAQSIKEAIDVHEPRARFVSADARTSRDRKNLEMKVYYRLVATGKTGSVSVSRPALQGTVP